MIEQNLKTLGFGKGEIDVYMALLRRKKATPASLAKETGINRTTVYSLAKTLIDKGVVSEDLAGSSKYLVAEPVERLAGILEREKSDLRRKEKTTEDLMEELRGIAAGTQYSVPRIRFVEERSILDHLYKNCGKWDESMLRACTEGWGFLDHTFNLKYGEWFDWYWKQASPDVRVHSYTNAVPSEEERMQDAEKRREIRIWDQETEFTATVWVKGEYLIMVVTNEHPHYLVEIHDSVLSHNMREYFKNTWH